MENGLSNVYFTKRGLATTEFAYTLICELKIFICSDQNSNLRISQFLIPNLANSSFVISVK